MTLNFVPTVLNTGLINVHLGPQVCQIADDHDPGRRQRNANPAVEQSERRHHGRAARRPKLRRRRSPAGARCRSALAIALAGNVPVLGALFRSTNYQKSETDLIVIVTVHLVRPVPPSKHIVTPFDTTLPANDVDLFLMGQTERKKKYTEFITSGGGLQGPYGHVLDAK